MNLGELRGRMTITVPEYAALIGRGRSAAYEDVRSGEIPSIRLGGRVLVLVPALLKVLGCSDAVVCALLATAVEGIAEQAQRDAGVTHSQTAGGADL